MRKLMMFITLLSSSSALAINSEGYVEIKELKAWGDKTDVYFAGNQEHQCSGENKTRFLASNSNTVHVSLLISAFSAAYKISLAYTCNDEGFPEINGIRVRK